MSSNANEVKVNIGKWEGKLEENITLRLEQAGEFLAGKMVDKITAGLSPALKPATVQAKGSSTPLIDTGELLSQITHKMEGETTVGIGVFGSRAEVAAVHEFGSPSKNIPERSFMRSAFNENKKGIVKIVKGE